jgi:putative ABC transport system ATP-binding protein
MPRKSVMSGGTPVNPVLELDHVSKVYAGGVHALDDVSLTVNAGELLAIVGPPGRASPRCST